jgi:hypothetical protein
VYASGHGSGSGHDSRYGSEYGSDCGLGFCVLNREDKIKIFTRRFGFRTKLRNKCEPEYGIKKEKIYTGLIN